MDNLKQMQEDLVRRRKLLARAEDKEEKAHWEQTIERLEKKISDYKERHRL